MQLIPLNDRVVIDREDPETVSKGGIHLTSKTAGKAQIGRVLAVGPGKVQSDGQRHRPGIHLGDRVVFKRTAGDEFSVGHRKLLIVSADDVLATLPESD